jgi:hypothetical protein
MTFDLTRSILGTGRVEVTTRMEVELSPEKNQKQLMRNGTTMRMSLSPTAAQPAQP